MELIILKKIPPFFNYPQRRHVEILRNEVLNFNKVIFKKNVWVWKSDNSPISPAVLKKAFVELPRDQIYFYNLHTRNL